MAQTFNLIPNDIEEIFFKMLNDDIGILVFEQWLYENKQLEHVLNDEDYLELISFGYKQKAAKYELRKLLQRVINGPKYEKWRLLEMLAAVLKKDKKMPLILMDFYDLYCHGYTFLYKLGMEYGLNVIVPSMGSAYTWEELPLKDQEKLLQSFFPEIENEVVKVIDLLNHGQVVPMGKIDELYYTFVDNRNENEK